MTVSERATLQMARLIVQYSRLAGSVSLFTAVTLYLLKTAFDVSPLFQTAYLAVECLVFAIGLLGFVGGVISRSVAIVSRATVALLLSGSTVFVILAVRSRL